MFSRLFGKPARPVAGDRLVTVHEVIDGFVQIDTLGFFGQHKRSPSGRFLLTWRDANDEGTRGGSRSSGEGRYYLLDGNRVVVEGRMERPNDGKVADNGVFILNDWLFTSELAGVFRAFRPDGSAIIARRFKANLFNNGLAPDGSLAVCQTANAPDHDGNKLTIFDLASGQETGSVTPESGWATSYRFPPGTDHVELEHRELGYFAYSVDGRFVDRERWVEAGLSAGDLYVAERLYRGVDGELSPALASRLIACVEVGLACDASTHPHTKAMALKLKGTCLEVLADPSKALDAYDQALALNPKVGVKRRADQLRKELNSMTPTDSPS